MSYNIIRNGDVRTVSLNMIWLTDNFLLINDNSLILTPKIKQNSFRIIC
jgi:hypothetical protein